MKTRLTLLITLAALVLAGCFVPSVNPLYTEKDLIFDPALVGTWGETNDDTRLVFTRDGEKTYKWTIHEKEGQSEFRAHLLRLGAHRFLDARVARMKGKWEGSEWGRAASVLRPAHVFFKISLTNDTLRLDALDPDWLNKLLKKDTQAIAHERITEPDHDDERILLTASTADLQRFILKHAGDTNAFAKAEPVVRLHGTAAKLLGK